MLPWIQYALSELVEHCYDEIYIYIYIYINYLLIVKQFDGYNLATKKHHTNILRWDLDLKYSAR
jgi:hypothetical protein